jgi:Fur family transcriptional regulator, ferric uptake regulator
MDDTASGPVRDMLVRAGIEPTPLRLLVAEVLDQAGSALAAADILDRVRRRHGANKVTLYRILDLFVERGLACRHSAGERALRYCLGSGFAAHPHCHAHCLRCGRTLCLPVTEGLVNLQALGAELPLVVTGVEVRIDGVCAACAAKARAKGPSPIG